MRRFGGVVGVLNVGWMSYVAGVRGDGRVGALAGLNVVLVLLVLLYDAREVEG